MVTRKELTEALWMSCVENYVLAWLNRAYDVRKLYGNSFVSVGRLFDDFSRGAAFERYGARSRLQHLAEAAGAIRRRFVRCRADEAAELLRRQDGDSLCLARVNANFFLNFKRSSWREDHYVCLDGEMNWINQYPLSEGAFSAERFAEVFDGALCLFETADLTVTPPDCNRESILGQTFPERLPEELRAVESAVWVLRVTRKRLAAYYREREEAVRLLTEELALLDEICFMVRLKQIKARQTEDREGLRTKTLAAVSRPLERVLELEQKCKEVFEA